MPGNFIGLNISSTFSWKSYWKTRFISALSVLTTSDTTQTITATIVGTGYDGVSYEYSTDGINYSVKGTAAGGTYNVTGLTADTLYYWRARLYKETNFGNYSSIDSKYTWNSQFKALYNSLTTKPSLTIAYNQNIMIKTIVDAGIWAKWDQAFLFAQTVNSSSEALKNILNPGTLDATLGVAPTFTALEGFQGNATDMYIRTHYNPSTNGVKYLQDDASVFIYIRKPGTVAAVKSSFGVTGVSGTGGMREYHGTDSAIGCNAAAGYDPFFAAPRGSYCISRSAAANFKLYKNKATLTRTVSSLGVPNGEMFILSDNFNHFSGEPNPSHYDDCQVSFYAIGGALTPTEEGIAENAVETYMISNQKGLLDTVHDGDSLTIGGEGVTAYPDLLPALCLADKGLVMEITNVAVAGDNIAALIARAAATDAYFDLYHHILVVFVGVNDLRYTYRTKEAVYTDLKSYCTARKATGWYVYVLTLLPQNNGSVPVNANYESDRQWYNTQIKTDLYPSIINGYIDVASDVNIGLSGCENDTTYYNADKIHLVQGGQDYLSTLVYAGIKDHLQGQ